MTAGGDVAGGPGGCGYVKQKSPVCSLKKEETTGAGDRLCRNVQPAFPLPRMRVMSVYTPKCTSDTRVEYPEG